MMGSLPANCWMVPMENGGKGGWQSQGIGSSKILEVGFEVDP